ncbi:MAG: AAA-like domain-containing protein, partial [Lachnospiraceae bacterium]|nr:AAA-like domain-containing protein [Lachnospiraceae bacterium]
MTKIFNVNGACRSNRHYMVDLKSRLEEIKGMIDAGEYFTINRARQYGKTTILRSLADFLKKDYQVVSLDFQNIESVEFANGSTFVHALAREINKRIRRFSDVPEEVREKIIQLADNVERTVRMAELFACFSQWCEQTEKPLVLIIDEVDKAANNEVFVDFLAQLRAGYLDRDEIPTFQSVILAGVYDVRSIRRKIRPDDAHKENSPWNI